MKIPSILEPKRFIRYIYNKRIDFGDILSSGLSASTKPVIWAHVNSLKELDMLQPVIKQFAQKRKYTILVTCHHSSVRYTGLGDYDCIDYLFTLPVNTDLNAELFISLAKPAVAIFLTLTDCSWYCNLLKNRNIPTFLIAEKRGHLCYVSQRTSFRLHIDNRKLYRKFEKYRPMFFCINDSQFADDGDREYAIAYVSRLFPDKSRFEK